MLEALIKEIDIRRNYLGDELIESIYFGGGTPSIIEVEYINNILSAVKANHTIANDVEITFEANPEDLSLEYLRQLKSIGVNRLSIGIQSMFDDMLLFINRRHSVQKALESIDLAREVGIDNISIDLIYGIPGLNREKWIETLEKIKDLPITHLSAYCLSIDENTVFEHRLRKGDFIPLSDEECEEQYDLLVAWAKENGFFHYEISNFCKDNLYSRHNTSYWQQKAYLGIGPGAHSYNKESRQWNFSHNKKYLEYINRGDIPMEIEHLSEDDRFNEYVMTALRTAWGIDKAVLSRDFGMKYYHHLIDIIKKHAEYVKEDDKTISLTEQGMFISNDIISDLFI
jgi:oxygen-independent coproporphyrinogen-3 oxidase